MSMDTWKNFFDIFIIDPPYSKQKGGIRKVRPKQGRSLDYTTLNIATIFELLDKEIFPMAKEIHTVFLWSIDEFLHIAEMAMEQRGYKRHARLIWDKGNGVAPAFSIRYAHEYLIWFYKPKFQPVAKASRGKIITILREPSREHSRKPNIAYELINFWYPNAVKIDIFSREQHKGWHQWGNEVNYFSDKSIPIEFEIKTKHKELFIPI